MNTAFQPNFNLGIAPLEFVGNHILIHDDLLEALNLNDEQFVKIKCIYKKEVYYCVIPKITEINCDVENSEFKEIVNLKLIKKLQTVERVHPAIFRVSNFPSAYYLESDVFMALEIDISKCEFLKNS